MTDHDVDAAVTLFRDWLTLNRDAEFAEWTFTLQDQRATVSLAEKTRFVAPEPLVR